jgi:hypothetical protein
MTDAELAEVLGISEEAVKRVDPASERSGLEGCHACHAPTAAQPRNPGQAAGVSKTSAAPPKAGANFSAVAAGPMSIRY